MSDERDGVDDFDAADFVDDDFDDETADEPLAVDEYLALPYEKQRDYGEEFLDRGYLEDELFDVDGFLEEDDA